MSGALLFFTGEITALESEFHILQVKMKILFLTGSLNQGGAEFQLLALAKLFKDRGHEVEVLALTDYSFYLGYVQKNVLTYKCFRNHQSKPRRIYNAIKEVNRFKPDCVIAYLRAVSLVALITKLFSSVSFKLITSERTSLTIPWYDLIYFNLSLVANAMTVNSISKLNYIRARFPLLKSKVYFIPNIVDLQRFAVPTMRAVNNRVKEIIYIGRISPEKNIDKLIQALKILHDEGFKFLLNMYGESRHPEYFSKIRSLVSQNEMNGYVKFHGPTDDVMKVYAQADLLCLMSAYEGFSNVLSEAIACGLPVVASNIEENKYLIDDKVNGFLVNAASIDDISEGIRYFFRLTNEETIAMGERNKRKALRIFDCDQLYNKYLSIMDQI
jgi:GalNAc-alpha-(1->4)-GalNAc-alpha-(1->3)-diNAcBac-PP-undecaprenol alpha-1,4-N-acetyl-D-galactosaminyltransferase